LCKYDRYELENMKKEPNNTHVPFRSVQDDPKLPDDNGEVPNSEWSGWQFDSRCEIFSLLDGEKLVRQVGRNPRAHPPQGRQ
jgi:hypothetical protein